MKAVIFNMYFSYNELSPFYSDKLPFVSRTIGLLWGEEGCFSLLVVIFIREHTVYIVAYTETIAKI